MIRNEIGFIFQGFNLIPGLTAFENVELPPSLPADRKAKTPKAGPRGPAEGRACSPYQAPAKSNVRRPAAAGGNRQGDRRQPSFDSGRRADRKPGQRLRGSNFSDFKAAEPGGRTVILITRRLYCPLRPAHYQNSRRQNSQKLRAGIH